MAAPSDVALSGGQVSLEQIVTQINNLVASMRLLTAKLDADTGVTDTNYDAVITISTITTAPAKLKLRA